MIRFITTKSKLSIATTGQTFVYTRAEAEVSRSCSGINRLLNFFVSSHGVLSLETDLWFASYDEAVYAALLQSNKPSSIDTWLTFLTSPMLAADAVRSESGLLYKITVRGDVAFAREI